MPRRWARRLQALVGPRRKEYDESSYLDAKTKVALTLDAELLERVDELVAKQRFRNRTRPVEAALADKVQRLARTRLARESAKLNPKEEKRLADEGLVDTLDSWPEY